MNLSCVILTMGDRPAELARAVRSVREQDGVQVEVVVIGNGVDPGPIAGARTVPLPNNVGIPAGRNRGVEETTGDVVLFLDDDGYFPTGTLGAHVRDAFRNDDRLGVLSFRVRDPVSGHGERRHVPRLRAGDPERSSEVTTFLGGACAVRRETFDKVGGFPDEFFYAHEETDFAWRAIDAGYRLRYDAAAVMTHPALPPTRHREFYRLNARNRVWLARRNLPWPVGLLYVVNWTVLTVLRVRRPSALRAWFGGFAEGWREPCGERRPIRWRSVFAMARAGRPPVI